MDFIIEKLVKHNMTLSLGNKSKVNETCYSETCQNLSTETKKQNYTVLYLLHQKINSDFINYALCILYKHLDGNLHNIIELTYIHLMT